VTTVVATLVFVLLAAAWCLAAARYGRSADRTPGERRGVPRAVFGRGIVAADGTWRPVGLPEPALDPGDPPAARASRLPAPRDEVVL
jgi:hypothetical protein